jgi:cytoskeleton-associated protein 5
VKEGTLKFINRCLANSTTPPLANQIKPLSESLANLLEDSFEGARNEAAVGLGTLMKIVGERLLNPIMEPMAEVRKVKVKEAFENATVRCKSGKKPAPPAPTKPAAAEKKSTKPSVAAAAGDSPSEPVSTPLLSLPKLSLRLQSRKWPLPPPPRDLSHPNQQALLN